jgi:hypothetical protein
VEARATQHSEHKMILMSMLIIYGMKSSQTQSLIPLNRVCDNIATRPSRRVERRFAGVRFAVEFAAKTHNCAKTARQQIVLCTILRRLTRRNKRHLIVWWTATHI